MINNIVADNYHTAPQGSGVYVGGSNTHPITATLLHNTIADNDGSGPGVYVDSYATLSATNTIIAGHSSVGISNTALTSSTVNLNNTLFHNNGVNYGSGVSSSNERSGDPTFVNPAAFDYHIDPGSAAMNTGVNAGVTTDIDGNSRPQGSGYDIGADEIVEAVATIPPTGGTLVSLGDSTAYIFPADTFTDTVVITHIARSPSNAPSLGKLIGISHFFEVTAVYSSTGQPAEPTRSYTITVQYTEAEIGLAMENTLALYYWNGSQWVKEPSSAVNAAANTVTATPNHFSSWAVLGETKRVFLPTVLKNY